MHIAYAPNRVLEVARIQVGPIPIYRIQNRVHIAYAPNRVLKVARIQVGPIPIYISGLNVARIGPTPTYISANKGY